MGNRTLRIARGVAGAGLLTAAALHLSWAAGSHWPAKSKEELSDVVTGSPQLPQPAACAVVGVGLVGVSAVVISESRHPLLRVARAGVALGFLARAAAGGVRTTRALGLPAPSARFLEWETKLYRPFCVAVAAPLVIDECRRRD